MAETEAKKGTKQTEAKKTKASAKGFSVVLSERTKYVKVLEKVREGTATKTGTDGALRKPTTKAVVAGLLAAVLEVASDETLEELAKDCDETTNPKWASYVRAVPLARVGAEKAGDSKVVDAFTADLAELEKIVALRKAQQG